MGHRQKKRRPLRLYVSVCGSKFYPYAAMSRPKAAVDKAREFVALNPEARVRAVHQATGDVFEVTTGAGVTEASGVFEEWGP